MCLCVVLKLVLTGTEYIILASSSACSSPPHSYSSFSSLHLLPLLSFPCLIIHVWISGKSESTEIYYLFRYITESLLWKTLLAMRTFQCLLQLCKSTFDQCPGLVLNVACFKQTRKQTFEPSHKWSSASPDMFP